MAPDRRIEQLAVVLGPGDGTVEFVRVPGRVNLIGEHTDYQDGFCLPVAIDLDVVLAWRRRGDDIITLHSAEREPSARIAAGSDPATLEPEWARPAAGMAAVFASNAGQPPPGLDIALASTLPIGSGLSSSAAVEVAMGIALSIAAERPVTGTELALFAQRAEHLSTGVPCGVMDQMACVHGRSGHALLLDCRTLDVTPVPLPDELAIVVVHCGVPRQLAGTEYAERRAAVEAAARAAGVAALRDALPETVEHDPRARHVVSENRRTLMFVAALRRARYSELGELMGASHASLRDDFEVSTPELDCLVESLVECGAIGARLTGAGFGGCAVALAPAGTAERIADDAAERYRARSGHEPVPFVVRASDGAGPLRRDD